MIESITILTFASAFLFVFGLNLLYSHISLERQSQAVKREFRQERRIVQKQRVTRSLENLELQMLASEGSKALKLRKPLSERIAHFYEQAGIRWQPHQIVAAGLAVCLLGAGGVWMFTHYLIPSAVTGVFCGIIPFLYVIFMRHRRMEKLLSQLPDAYDMISRSLRAGQTFTNALNMTANESSAPLSDELGYCYDQQHLGMPPDVALRELSRRTGLLEVKIFSMAVTIHKQSGGNLSDLLENLASVIRERYRIRGVIKILTAEGRMQGLVLTAIPVVLLILLTLFKPSYVQPLYDRPWLLPATAIWMSLGGIWIHHILKFDY